MNKRITPCDPELAKSITKEGQRIVRELSHSLEDKISMNERIRELAEQCYEYKAEMLDIWFNKEKFAELIVRECASVIEKNHPEFTCKEDADNLYRKAGRMDAIDEILQHFGVEE